MYLTPFVRKEQAVPLNARQQERIIEIINDTKSGDTQHGIRLTLGVLGYEITEKQEDGKNGYK